MGLIDFFRKRKIEFNCKNYKHVPEPWGHTISFNGITTKGEWSRCIHCHALLSSIKFTETGEFKVDNKPLKEGIEGI